MYLFLSVRAWKFQLIDTFNFNLNFFFSSRTTELTDEIILLKLVP